MYSYTLKRWGLKYSGDTYASYRSRSANRLVGIYKRSNSEQLLNAGFSQPNADDVTQPELWKSDDDLSRIASYKVIAPKSRKSIPDNGQSLSRQMPADLSASWSPHYEPAARQDAVTFDTDDEEAECLVSVKQRIQRLEETKPIHKHKDGQKRRVPPPVPEKPRSLSLRGPADFPSFKSNPPEKQCSLNMDTDEDLPQVSHKFNSTSDLSEVDKDSGVSIEPNITPSLHWMLVQKQQQSKLKNLYPGGRGSDPDLSKLKDTSNSQSSLLSQGYNSNFSQSPSSDGYSTLPSKKRRPMRASTGSVPSLVPEQFLAKSKDTGLLHQPVPTKPRSPKPRYPKPVARNSSGYHTLPRSSVDVMETERSSPEVDGHTGNTTSDEDGGFHEDPDLSLSKSQLERMSSSFPSPHSTSTGDLERDPDYRKLSLENLVISDEHSPTRVRDNTHRSPSPRQISEVSPDGKPKPKPKPKQRHRQSNSKKHQTEANSTPKTAHGKRANFVVSHSRRPSQEELEFEEIAKDLSQNLKENDKELINVLNPNNKRATDFVRDLLENTHFDTTLLPEVSKENSQNLDSQENTNSISNSHSRVIADKCSIPSLHRAPCDGQNDDNLIQKKEELRVSIEKKLEALQENKMKVEQEMDDINSIGEKIGKLFDESCENSQAKLKFKSYVEDLEMVIRLLMKLSVLLARAENSVQCLPAEADTKKRNLAVEKRNRLSRQHEEAKQLKSDIDRRQEHITNLLSQHLLEDGLKEFHYYISMKLRLIVELQELEDKIYQGEEQLVALKRSIPLTLTSLGSFRTATNTSASTVTNSK